MMGCCHVQGSLFKVKNGDKSSLCIVKRQRTRQCGCVRAHYDMLYFLLMIVTCFFSVSTYDYSLPWFNHDTNIKTSSIVWSVEAYFVGINYKSLLLRRRTTANNSVFLGNDCPRRHEGHSSEVICHAVPGRRPIRHGKQTTTSGERPQRSKNLIRRQPSKKSSSVTNQSQPPSTDTTTENGSSSLPSTSIQYAMDPTSKEATRLIQSTLQLTQHQHDLLIQLCHLIVKWNDSINLISRKDCTVNVVFGRHVLPSLAVLNLPNSPFRRQSGDSESESDSLPRTTTRVIDIGTGGGFPGLPMAIACSDENYQFTLVDSVGKKVKVVQSIAEELGLKNLQTHHGRAEEMIYEFPSKHHRAYDVCVGRSVASLPKFCTWIDELLIKDQGKLVYIIGGDVEDIVMTNIETDVSLSDVIDCPGASDKRALVIHESSVATIASQNGRKAIANSAKSNVKARLSQQPKKQRRPRPEA